VTLAILPVVATLGISAVIHSPAGQRKLHAKSSSFLGYKLRGHLTVGQTGLSLLFPLQVQAQLAPPFGPQLLLLLPAVGHGAQGLVSSALPPGQKP